VSGRSADVACLAERRKAETDDRPASSIVRAALREALKAHLEGSRKARGG
jgi:hypothetical protein